MPDEVGGRSSPFGVRADRIGTGAGAGRASKPLLHNVFRGFRVVSKCGSVVVCGNFSPKGSDRRTVTIVDTELRFDRWFLPLSVPLGLGPKNSDLRVEAGNLHVKMGWAFTATIPLASIRSAE